MLLGLALPHLRSEMWGTRLDCDGLAALGVVLVAFVDEAQAGEGEHLVDVLDVLAVGGDELGQAAGGDGFGGGA